jgi:enoyl-CoA hydratase/carnithine racemase
MSLVLYELRDHISYITLNRPEKLNAINPEMREELHHAFLEVRDNPDVWLAIITGQGRAFCTGHDLVAMAEGVERPGATTDDLYIMEASIWKPILVAVNGICLAQGCGLALSADIRIASEQAQLGWPQVKRGISSVSGPTMLAQRVPLGRAMEILFTGDFFSAQEALDLGLVNRVVPHSELMAETEALARKILANAPLAVRAIKEAAIRGLGLPLDQRVRIARQTADRVKQSEDTQEGLAAFREKRAPVWRGR